MDNPKFWGVSSVDDMDEIPNPDGVAALRTRVIEFSGKFEPVKWSCRAPLPSGKLCPRKDRYKVCIVCVKYSFFSPINCSVLSRTLYQRSEDT